MWSPAVNFLILLITGAAEVQLLQWLFWRFLLCRGDTSPITVTFGMSEGTKVPYAVPNFTLIGAYLGIYLWPQNTNNPEFCKPICLICTNPLHSIHEICKYKCLANAKKPCGCSVLSLCLKSSLCSCPHGLHYMRIVLFTREFYQLTEQLLHIDATTG